MASLIIPGIIIGSTTGVATVAAVSVVLVAKLRQRFTSREDRYRALMLLENINTPFDPEEIEQLVQVAPSELEGKPGTTFERPGRKGTYVKEKKFGKLVIRRVDEPDDGIQDLQEASCRNYFHNMRKNDIVKLATTIAQECRFTLNIQRETEANRLVARSWLMNKATELQLTVRERKTFIAFAVPVVFLPTEDEIEVARMLNTGPIQAHVDNAKTRFISWTPPCKRYPFGKIHFATRGVSDA